MERGPAAVATEGPGLVRMKCAGGAWKLTRRGLTATGKETRAGARRGNPRAPRPPANPRVLPDSDLAREKEHRTPSAQIWQGKWGTIKSYLSTRARSTSCRLFMLNFKEYWTGELLSDQFTQEDMKEFRRKLAVILLETELNKLKGSPIYYEPDNEEKESDSDVELLDDRKRKRQDTPDGAEDKSPLPAPIMGVDPHDLVDKICNDIMSINDADLLE
ncbi:hypothetical protein D1007_30385 [Hordeum vulgare]|nr:hypothetical protein D1007_30385 [Hordeum vulgare]